MANILVTSKQVEEKIKLLVDRETPSYRQAYSDRMAWVMACISELVYLKFNPPIISGQKKDIFLKQIAGLIDDKKKSILLKIIDQFGYDHIQEKKNLENELEMLKYEIKETFDVDGTQAILIENDKHLVLAFRGTESSSIKDIKTDLKAVVSRCETGGHIHTGFKEAFEKVRRDIEKTLNNPNLRHKSLLITGHSLGGALATIAAKKITHPGGNAACYTFGSPRVGDEEWISNIKTPLYRLVNSADCVTMLPMSSEFISLLAWALGFIPNWGPIIRKWLLAKVSGYRHGGNMRYLTNAPKKGDYQKVKLLYSVSWFRRVKAFVTKKLPFKKFLSDHSISVYRNKLFVVAQNRNLDLR